MHLGILSFEELCNYVEPDCLLSNFGIHDYEKNQAS